jgi:predicted phosphodiesterase
MTYSKRTLEMSDLHIPFHDPHALELTVRIISVLQPDRIIINGDAVDFYEVSDFDKNPDRLRDGGMQREIDGLGEFLAEVVRAKPAASTIDFLPGNHEDRLRRHLWRHPQLFGLRALELPNLLELPRYGVNYYPAEIPMANGRLIVKHGALVRKAGGMTALAELEAEKYDVSTLTGHTHRVGSTTVRKRSGIVGGWEGGCLCELNPEYVRNPNWQQCVTVITETVDSDSFSVAQVPFLGRGRELHAVVEGRTVRL